MTLYSFIRGIVKFICNIIFKIRIIGMEHIPEEGNIIICSNHINVLDPIMIAFTTKRPIHFMGKKELFDNKFFNWFLRKMNAFPVDREASDIKAVKTSLTILKNDGILGIFPEGTRVNQFDVKNAKPGIAMIALKSKSPIIPIHIESDYKLFKPVTLTIGEKIDYSDLYGQKLSTESYKKLSEELLYKIYDLK